ncbi:MAG: hypothetical protein LBG48_04715 [Rickettsiales bacterium]|jgi:hypothetical protein|nr:hypothetical protein [Rickettsiales bacterium]
MTDKKINDFIKSQEKKNDLFEIRIKDMENSFGSIFNKVFMIEQILNLPCGHEEDDEDKTMDEKGRKKKQQQK